MLVPASRVLGVYSDTPSLVLAVGAILDDVTASSEIFFGMAQLLIHECVKDVLVAF